MSDFRPKKPWCTVCGGGSSHSIEIADQEDADGWTVKASLLQTSGGSEDCQGLGERPFMLVVENTLAVMGFS